MSLKVYYDGDTIINESNDCMKQIKSKGKYLQDDITIDYKLSQIPNTDIYFFDYNGTLLTTWTQEDLAKAVSLPIYTEDNVMAFDEWNWTLQELKTYAKYGCSVGALVHTKSGAIEADIDINNSNFLTPCFGLASVKGTMSVDWGDGTSDNYTANNANVNMSHTYAQTGLYTVKINVSTLEIWKFRTNGYVNYGNYFLWNGVNLNSGYGSSAIYRSYLKRLRLPQTNQVSPGNGAFAGFRKMDYFTIPSQLNIDNVVITADIFIMNKHSNGNHIAGDKVTSIPYGYGINKTLNFQSSKSWGDLCLYGATNAKTSGQAFQLSYKPCLTKRIIFEGEGWSTTGSSGSNCPNNIESIILLPGVTTIGGNGFANCSNLIYCIIPEGVTTIKNAAFAQCGKLINISLPNTLTTIEQSAFSNCLNLLEIILPKNVTIINNFVFSGCASLETIIIQSDLIQIGNSAFSGCTSLKNIIIPNSVTQIGNSAFSGCASLENIIIPNSVTEIGNSAFSGICGLTTIKIPPLINCGNTVFQNTQQIQQYDFTDWTISDLQNCTFGTNIFSGITTGKILFATQAIAEEAQQTTNLTTYANYITYVGAE